MPHVLDNSVVNLDILPGAKAEEGIKPAEMAEKAPEEAKEGANAGG